MMTMAAAPPPLARTEFQLWGGVAVVAVTDEAALDAALCQVQRIVAAFDEACSSFRTDSELALLNRSEREPVAVSSLLFTAVSEAIRAARLTNGAVDPTVGQALVAYRINPPLADESPVQVAPARGYRSIRLDSRTRRITLPAGVQLDLGATAKALAADMAAQAASDATGAGTLVGLCGDIAVAGDAPEGGWKIRVTDDHRRGEGPGQTVVIRSGGLATSSVTVRRAGADGTVPHLIDPASGRPLSGPWRTASASGRSCLSANTASTAALILASAAPKWLEARAVSARLVSHGGHVVHTAGWPQGADDLWP